MVLPVVVSAAVEGRGERECENSEGVREGGHVGE